MKTYSDITIHHPFSSSVQKEKYLLSYNGQYYEASHAIVELVEELQGQGYGMAPKTVLYQSLQKCDDARHYGSEFSVMDDSSVLQ